LFFSAGFFGVAIIIIAYGCYSSLLEFLGIALLAEAVDEPRLVNVLLLASAGKLRAANFA